MTTKEELLYTGAVTDIAALVETCHFPLDAYILVERQPRTVIGDGERQNLLRFDRLKDVLNKGGFDIGSYTSGRVFHQDFELRWEQDAVTAGKTSVVYIGVGRELPDLTKSDWTVQPEDEDKDKEHPEKMHHYYLFGELLSQDKQTKMGLNQQEGYEYYAETRVPRLLRYPNPEQGRQPQYLKLTVQGYLLIDSKGKEQGRTYRFLKLIEAKEGKHESV
jgi:hypothetical protein